MKGEVNRIRAYLEDTCDFVESDDAITSDLDSNLDYKRGTDGASLADVAGDSIHDESTIASELADVLDHYLQQLEAGKPISTDDLVVLYPHLEASIREYVQGLDLLNAGLSELTDSPFQGSGGQGTELGDFEIVREIGRGGMGVVYEARQLSLGRTVALKILPFAAMLDQRRVVRFEAEARAAASLRHAHIVPVYATGCDQGIHYYAMQLIEGRSIRDVIDSLDSRATESSAMTPRDAARLGTQAANALHAAHQCGIVHRDIKPSNLLLDVNDDVWITDFGVAQCQTEDHVTRSGDVLGTLHYMSPEQAHGNSAIADPRSDIYSMGITLYELLTSRRPFEGDSHTEIIQQIELGQFKSIRSVNPDVPRDLENVVAKAMSVDPAMRYQTASELEDDLQRFVDGRATYAKPPSKVQLFSRWAARNRALVFACVLAMLVTSVGLGATSFWLAGARSELAAQHAVANKKLAATELTLEEFGMATAERLKQIPGSQSARRALLSQLLTHYEDLLRTTENDPALREDRAVTSTKIANVYRESGDLEQALETYSRAEADFRLLLETAAEQENAHWSARLAKCLSNMSVVLMELGELEKATVECERAILLQKRIAKTFPTSSALLDLAYSYSNLDSIRRHHDNADLQHLEQAAQLADQALQQCSRDDERLEGLSTLALICGRMSVACGSSLPDAISHAERAVDASRELVTLTEGTENTAYRSACAVHYNNLASLHVKQNENTIAAQLFASAADELEAIEEREDLVVTLSNLGKCQSREKNYQSATRTYQRAITVQAALLFESPGNLNHQSRLGGLYNNIAFSLYEMGEREHACHAYESAIKYQDRAYQLAPKELTYYRDALSRTLFNASEAHKNNDHPKRAVELHLRRSKLWPHDAKQLFSVAYKIAAAANRLNSTDPRRHEWCFRAKTVLKEAIKNDKTSTLDASRIDKLTTYVNATSQPESWSKP